MPPDNQALRRSIKAQRRALSADEIAAASVTISATLLQLPALRRARYVATYLPAFGEVDCGMLTAALLSRGKRIFMPILRKNRLLFAPYDHAARMTCNTYGIPEPVCDSRALRSPRQLDVVITPLVAFDRHGNRLGMGGGYYDRSFAFRNRLSHWRKPLLIGVAYSFQQVDAMCTQPWDVPLDAVVTEKECFGSY